MRRRMALVAFGTLTLLAGPVGSASAQPTTDTTGCQTVASKFLNEDEPGHQGQVVAGNRSRGEGPCGFGDPPTEG